MRSARSRECQYRGRLTLSSLASGDQGNAPPQQQNYPPQQQYQPPQQQYAPQDQYALQPMNGGGRTGDMPGFFASERAST